jgi:hypothetical protein
MERKIEAMYKYYGVLSEHVHCKECIHFYRCRVGASAVSKSECYGMTHSEATDWKASNIACGLFNLPYSGTPIIELVKHSSCTNWKNLSRGRYLLKD